MKTIAINLVGGVSCTIRANDGVHSAYNILVAPSKYLQTAFLTIRDADKNYAGRVGAPVQPQARMEGD